jgi:hypothetical protein
MRNSANRDTEKECNRELGNEELNESNKDGS